MNQKNFLRPQEQQNHNKKTGAKYWINLKKKD